MNYNDRKTIHIDLALGMKSEENSLQRLQIIKSAQMQLTQEVTAGVSSGALTPAAFKKIRKPYEDMLYVLGVKDCDVYLPTEQEVMDMVKQSQQAKASAPPSPDDQKKMASAQLDQIRGQQIQAEVAGNTAAQQLEGYALIKEHKARAYGQ
jgi:hypothetical protein